MAKYLVQDTTLRGLADEIRRETGKSDPLLGASMTDELRTFSDSLTDEIALQNVALDDLEAELNSLEEGIRPEGTLSITENGTYDVTDKANVEVNVAGENKLSLVVNDVNGGTSTYFDITNDDLCGVTKIKDYAFFNCQGMQSIQLDNITSIGGSAFKSCIRLKSVEMPQLTYMKDSAFSWCYNLQSAKMPLAPEIGTDAFNGCSSLTEVELSNATTIGQRAFYGCNALTEVEMPSATRIKAEAFSWSKALVSVKMPVVQTIEASAFFGCDMLTTLTIPSSCSSIGDIALQCGTTTNKCTFTFEATAPPTISSRTFDNSKINKIIVPAGCGEAYKTATNWTTVADYIEEATE